MRRKTFRVSDADRLEHAQSAPQAKRTLKSTKGVTAKVGRLTGRSGAKKTVFLAATLQVLKDADHPTNTRQIADRVLAKNVGQTTGKTPATLHAAILREIRECAARPGVRRPGGGSSGK